MVIQLEHVQHTRPCRLDGGKSKRQRTDSTPDGDGDNFALCDYVMKKMSGEKCTSIGTGMLMVMICGLAGVLERLFCDASSVFFYLLLTLAHNVTHDKFNTLECV